MDLDARIATIIGDLDLRSLDEHELWSLLAGVNSFYRQSNHRDRQAWASVRDSVRVILNERVRPKLGGLGILDLPDELLRHVFEYVRGETGIFELSLFYFPRGDTRDIQSLRLTCRRFCETSSHLLFYHMRVELTLQSLTRLAEVSSHPFVSKGIRCLKLSLGPFYTATLAGDIRVFAECSASKLRDSIESWENAIEWRLPDLPTPVEVYQAAIAKAVPLAESWREAADQGIDTTSENHLMLSRAHARYRQRYQDHNNLCGSFAEAVASAMMRMPTATWVQIDSGENREFLRDRIIFPNDLYDQEMLMVKLMSPLDWEDARRYELGPPPFHIVGEFFLSLQRLGIRPKRIDIMTPPPTSGLPHEPTPEEQQIRGAVQQLEAFQFHPTPNIWNTYWIERPAHEWAPFLRFFSHLLSTKSIRSINLSFYFMGYDNPPPLLSMAQILLSYTWPNLEILNFTGPFHLQELRTVIRYLGRNVKIQWAGYLMSGSWADVLDVLKEYDSSETNVGDVNGSVYGQECDEMTQEEWDTIFKPRPTVLSNNKATKYIQNWPNERSNPIRDWEAGTLVIPGELVGEEQG